MEISGNTPSLAKKILWRWVVFLILIGNTCFASDVDSLKVLLNKTKIDTSRLNLLLEIANETWRSEPDTALKYTTLAIDIAEKNYARPKLALALKNLGLVYYVKGDYANVLSYWQRSLEEYSDIGDQVGMSNLLSNIGAVYYNLGDNPKALEYYLESLKVSEKMENNLRILTALTNIGAVYSRNSSTYDKAEAYLLRALPLAEGLEDQDGVGTISVNLGDLFLKKGDTEKAILYFEKALDAMKQTQGNESYVLSSMGRAYLNDKNYTKALELQKEALSKANQKNAKLEKTIALYGLGDTYSALDNALAAKNNYLEALKVAREIGSKEEEKNILERLARVYANLGQYAQAYALQTEFSTLKDTIFNIENEKRMEGLQFQFEIEKKEDQIELLNKENALKEAEIKRAKNFRNFLLITSGFLLLLIGGVAYQYNFVRKTNKIIIEERNKTDQLLRNILPTQTAEELKQYGTVKAKKYHNVTVLFTDFVNFTKHVEKIPPEILVRNIDFYFKKFDEIFEKHRLEKIKTIGDAYMCAGSLPIINQTHPSDAVKAGLEILEFIQSIKESGPEGIYPFNVRIGINTGPVIAGVVGKSKFQYDIWGDAVNVASRMETSCDPNQVNISETTFYHVKDLFEFEYRGNLEVKNRGKINMYYVKGMKETA